MLTSAFVATSLDGFIAKKDGSLEWLDDLTETSGETSNETEDYGYDAFYSQITCLVKGRKTFEQVLTFPQWPFEGKRVIVLSHTLETLPETLTVKSEIFSGSLGALIAMLQSQGEGHLYVDGGQTIQTFISEGLLNDITITRVPVLLGEGRPLFKMSETEVYLNHLETKIYSNGFVQSRYEFQAL
jgi:dihydrofolate reductase